MSDAIVRADFGFEQIRWSPDGKRLLVKLLPEGETLTSAARLLPSADEARLVPNAKRGDAVTARVYSALGDSSAPVVPNAVTVDHARSFMNAALADLALVDVATGGVRRIARHVRPMLYRFSPDGSRLLLSSRHPYDARGQLVWSLYETSVLDTSGRAVLRLPAARCSWRRIAARCRGTALAVTACR